MLTHACAIGERTKTEKEERERDAKNAERAKLIYSPIDPDELEDRDDLPWGGISMKYVLQTGKAKDKLSGQSSAAGSSSNLGQGRGSSSR